MPMVNVSYVCNNFCVQKYYQPFVKVRYTRNRDIIFFSEKSEDVIETLVKTWLRMQGSITQEVIFTEA